MLHLPTVANRAEENHDLRGEVGEAGKSDRGERGEAEDETSEWHYFCKSAQFIERERAGSVANLSGDCKQERNRQSMREDQGCGAGCSKNVRARDSKKDVTHVHHARITEHPIELFLRDGDESDVNNVAEQKNREQVHPIMSPVR